MKKKLATLASVVLIPGGMAANPGMAAVLNRLKALQQQLRNQQVLIEQLQEQVNRQQQPLQTRIAEIAKQEVDSAIEKKTPGEAVVKLGKNIDRIALKGDFRIRYENRNRDDQSRSNRDRMRARFRLGGVWRNRVENWEIAAGLATGEPGIGSATSSNDTWSENDLFETGKINLDYAYAKHTFTLGGTNLTGIFGQQKNPFVTSWLLWDTDVRPAGFTFKAENSGLFGTVGYYDVYNNGDEITEMIGAQIGFSGGSDRLEGTVAAACYSFDDGVWKDVPVRSYASEDFRFQIADLYGELAIPIGETGKLKLYGEYFVNAGADGGPGEGARADMELAPDNENHGWLVGAELKQGKLKLAYAYGGMGEDAAIPGLVDADFTTGIGTDVEGHRVKASYKLTANCYLSLLGQVSENLTRTDVGKVKLYQLDLGYKF